VVGPIVGADGLEPSTPALSDQKSKSLKTQAVSGKARDSKHFG